MKLGCCAIFSQTNVWEVTQKIRPTDTQSSRVFKHRANTGLCLTWNRFLCCAPAETRLWGKSRPPATQEAKGLSSRLALKAGLRWTCSTYHKLCPDSLRARLLIVCVLQVLHAMAEAVFVLGVKSWKGRAALGEWSQPCQLSLDETDTWMWLTATGTMTLKKNTVTH